jgi:hypothetical protein
VVQLRGDRDGFGAEDFHERCDGHAKTLTVSQDMTGNAFGGFTALEWESRRGIFCSTLFCVMLYEWRLSVPSHPSPDRENRLF